MDYAKMLDFHKKNNAPILVTMEFDDWMTLYREFEAGRSADDDRANENP